MELNYTKVGDYLLPNLTIKKQNYGEINKYGCLRLHYLKENNKALYTTLLIEQYKKSDKLLSEKSKENKQLEWVKLANNYKNLAEEIILKELIYTENV